MWDRDYGAVVSHSPYPASAILAQVVAVSQLWQQQRMVSAWKKRKKCWATIVVTSELRITCSHHSRHRSGTKPRVIHESIQRWSPSCIECFSWLITHAQKTWTCWSIIGFTFRFERWCWTQCRWYWCRHCSRWIFSCPTLPSCSFFDERYFKFYRWIFWQKKGLPDFLKGLSQMVQLQQQHIQQ